MQVVYKIKDERDSSQRANLVDVIVCAGRINGYLEGEHVGEFRGGMIRI